MDFFGKTLNCNDHLPVNNEICILDLWEKIILWSVLIMINIKSFIGGNFMTAFLPVPKILPVFEFALLVDLEFLIPSAAFSFAFLKWKSWTISVAFTIWAFFILATSRSTFIMWKSGTIKTGITLGFVFISAGSKFTFSIKSGTVPVKITLVCT